MTLEIISAHEVTFSGEVTAVTLPGEMGSFTVLKDHAPLISVLVKGSVVYTDASGSKGSFDIAGGLADVNDNVISVCVY
ncbi:MAG: F0F1 ATP synthase subunit epsilon [Bacteroidales bacterium]|nr:F0F1 ATP synthase subunit epsilon [Bacteroidales bacterium]MBD5222807.1 F0F1 ATP synthase subunit epsilon [Bacteroidales bacterium]MBD5302197.1 F0F1 ATP synthase subunit epsilon [Bacteroides sp.]